VHHRRGILTQQGHSVLSRLMRGHGHLAQQLCGIEHAPVPRVVVAEAPKTCSKRQFLKASPNGRATAGRIGESRAPLRAARETFDALAFHGLAETARRELRASGETSGQRIPDARESLSPQELQIAEMAAAGLSNRKIGQRLFLSHRTVESHLYRIYRKLGLTSRVQLSAALPHAATPVQQPQH
jgi:DNA-binding CsgD family transcriptional regulator